LRFEVLDDDLFVVDDKSLFGVGAAGGVTWGTGSSDAGSDDDCFGIAAAASTSLLLPVASVIIATASSSVGIVCTIQYLESSNE
jgi:hypothetical protein